MARQQRPSAGRYQLKKDFAPKKRSPLSTAKVITRERSRSPSRNRSPCLRFRSPLRKALASQTHARNTRSRSRSTRARLVNDTTQVEYYDVDPGNVLIEEGEVVEGKDKRGNDTRATALPTPRLTPEQVKGKHGHLQSFPQFSKLKPAIRDQIWSYLLPEPRTIIVRLSLVPQPLGQPLNLSYQVTRFKVPTPPSGLRALLGTCRESRGVALRSHRRLLGVTPQIKELSPEEMLAEENRKAEEEARYDDDLKHLAGIREKALQHLQSLPKTRNFYFSPALDTLLFSEETFLKFCWARRLINKTDNYITEAGSEIKRIMIRQQFGDYKEGIIPLLTRFTGLRFLGLCWDERGKDHNAIKECMDDEKHRFERWIEAEWKKVAHYRRREIGPKCVVEVYTRMEMDRKAEWS